MIFLDTNYLIGLVGIDSSLGDEVEHWVEAGEILSVSSIAWSEFLAGPVTADQLRNAEIAVGGRIVSFGAAEASCAADLFRGSGRKRERKIDGMIAATSIVAGMKLATRNKKDFLPFVSFGLKLI